MITIALDVLLVLSLVAMILVTSLVGRSFGPDGAVGLWLVLLPPWFFMGIILLATVLSGKFDWIPGGRFTGVVMLLGLMIGVGTAMFFIFDDADTLKGRLIGLIPYLVLAGCAGAVHFLHGPMPVKAGGIATAAVLAVCSLAGWGVVANYGLGKVQEDMLRVQQRAEAD